MAENHPIFTGLINNQHEDFKLKTVLQKMLTWFCGSPLERTPQEQLKIDQETEKLALYQYDTCPFCCKVRRAMRQLSLNIEIRDIHQQQQYRHELAQKGGNTQVPCLKIDIPGQPSQWLYESSDIVNYLKQHFA